MIAFLYLGIKFLAYSFWMYMGFRSLRAEATPSVLRSFALGFLRLFLGFFFGLLIYFGSGALLSVFGYGTAENILTYSLVYVPVRWIEWGIMSLFLVSPGGSRFFLGQGRADRFWRIGGIGISCLADIPLIISLGGVIPTGRFLC